MRARSIMAAMLAVALAGSPLLAQEKRPAEGGKTAQPTPGAGDSPEGILKQLQDAKNNIKAARTNLGVEEQEEANNEKRKKLWTDQEREIWGKVNAAMSPYLKKEADYTASLKRYDEAKTKVEGRCPPGNKIPPAVYAKCKQDKAGNDRWKGRLDARRKALDGENAAIQKLVKTRLKPVVAARKKAEENLAKARAQLAKLRKNVEGWNRYIASLEKRFRVACSRPQTCQALKLCAGFRWTGAPPSLPPLPADQSRC